MEVHKETIRMVMGCIMASLRGKTDGQSFDSSDINEPYAFIYSNMIAFNLDGLGSTLHQNVYTNPFATDTGSVKTNVDYGTGSFGHGGTLVGSLILNPITVGSTFNTICPFVQGTFVNGYSMFISFDNGATYNEYQNRKLGSAVGTTGSGIVFKFHFNNTTTGSDILHGLGFYWG